MKYHHHHHHSITKQMENGAEKKTLVIIIITAIMMIAEIITGYLSNSMALLADGWHMGTHAFALFITYLAYIFMRKYKESDIFALGTGKISSLAAYTSAIFLGLTAFWIIAESITRLLNPLKIGFNEAIFIAIIGLVVNGMCLIVLEDGGKKEDEDYNFKSAYLHILTDAFTSVLAILALILGKFFNLYKLDPIIGILGGIIILGWAFGLIKDTSKILLDMNDKHMSKHIKEYFENNNIQLKEFKIWKSSEQKYCLKCQIKYNGNCIEKIKGDLNNIGNFDLIAMDVFPINS